MTALDLNWAEGVLFGRYVLWALRWRDEERPEISEHEIYRLCLAQFGLECHHPKTKKVDWMHSEFCLLECLTCQTMIYYDFRPQANG